jgi:hypothetical protein
MSEKFGLNYVYVCLLYLIVGCLVAKCLLLLVGVARVHIRFWFIDLLFCDE